MSFYNKEPECIKSPTRCLSYWPNDGVREYETTDRQSPAVVWAIMVPKDHLNIYQISVKTGGKELEGDLNLTDSTDTIGCWQVHLFECQLTVTHCARTRHQPFDASL